MKYLQISTRHADLPDVTADQHHAQAHGVADHADRAEHLWCGVAEGHGSVGLTVAGSTPGNEYPIARFVDATDSAWTWYVYAPDLKSGTSVTLDMWFADSLAETANYSIRVQVNAIANGGAVFAASSNTDVAVATGNTTTYQHVSITFPTTMAAGGIYRITVQRRASSDAATDTATGDLYLLGIMLSYTSQQ